MLSQARFSAQANRGRAMRGLVVCGLLGLLLASLLAQSAAAQTMAGNTFESALEGNTVSGNCAADGSGSVNFHFEGLSGLTVPGRFVETGSFLLGPLQPFGATVASEVLSFEAHFEVRTFGGTLLAEGDKRLIEPVFGRAGFGRCPFFPTVTLAETTTCYRVHFAFTGTTEIGLTRVDISQDPIIGPRLIEQFTGPDTTGTCADLFCDRLKEHKKDPDKNKCKDKAKDKDKG
jgi:hypothetical protein